MLSPPEEDDNVTPRYSADLFARIEPTDLETESVTIVPLRALDIRNW